MSAHRQHAPHQLAHTHNHSHRVGRRLSGSKLIIALCILTMLATFPVLAAGATAGARQQSHSGEGIPFGPTKLPPEEFGAVYNGTKIKVYPKHAIEDLDTAREGGMRVFLVLAGSQSNYRNPDGTFNLAMWKSQIDRFRDFDFSEYVDDGTIVAHQLIEEAKARKQWGGTVIHNDVLDEMARYSKQLWPTMPTVVRVEPTKLAKHAAGWLTPSPDFEWQYLDGAWAQYSDRKGTASGYAIEQQTSADAQRLGLVLGLNVLNGGDGSSGIPSPHSSGEWAMSPDELRSYGTALMENARGCGFMMWRYETPDSGLEDFVYFRRADIAAAVADLAEVAAGVPRLPCSGAWSGVFRDDDFSIFESDIDWIAAEGITKGCNPPANDRFCPDDLVTRGQMAAFLVRALGYVNDGGGDLYIDDDSSIFEGDIDRLGTAGVTKGCNPPANDRFCPDDLVTRGQMAAFLHRALRN